MKADEEYEMLLITRTNRSSFHGLLAMHVPVSCHKLNVGVERPRVSMLQAVRSNDGLGESIAWLTCNLVIRHGASERDVKVVC